MITVVVNFSGYLGRSSRVSCMTVCSREGRGFDFYGVGDVTLNAPMGEQPLLLKGIDGKVAAVFPVQVCDGECEGVYAVGNSDSHECQRFVRFIESDQSKLIEAVRGHFANVLPTPENADGRCPKCGDVNAVHEYTESTCPHCGS